MLKYCKNLASASWSIAKIPTHRGKYLLSVVLLWSATTMLLHAKSSPETSSGLHSKVKSVDVKYSKGTPYEINYQGWLGDATDTNEVTDVLDMKFRLYDAETEGTLLWNETQSAVNVNKGIFNVLLGSVSAIPSNIFTGDPLWLETQVENDTLTPRKKLVSVGYAIKSKEAEHSIYSDTTNYALDANVNIDSVIYADTAGYVTGANVDGEVAQANHSDTADYVIGGVGDNDWTISGNNMYSAVPGSVGIGVVSPTEKLDINGAINTSSSYKIGGNTVLSDSGTGNIFVGVGAGENITVTGGYNTFVGDSAGYSNTGGGPNTFLGYLAGYSNITGACNTFLGDWAGYKNTTGLDNTFSGHYTGYYNTTGYNNTFLGSNAGWRNTEGYDNTFLGQRAGFCNKTGGLNTFLGRWAGYHNITGASNVFLGYRAGFNNTTDSSKLYIANGSDDANVLIYGEFDEQRLGLCGVTSPTHTIDVNGGAYCTGTNWVNSSSREYKENINELGVKEAIEAVNGLKPVRFNYKIDKENECVGFIAEDVPELVATKDRKGMSAMDVVAVLTKVVQNQQEKIAELEKRIAEIER